jgi:RHS repeat-associated protein
MISTTTAVSADVNPSAYGGPVNFTASITGASSGPDMTGTVTFFDGHVALGSAAVTGFGNTGSATLTVSSLTGGQHSITATYSGDSNYSNSTSPVLTQTVTKVLPGFSLTPTPSPVWGQPVDLVVHHDATQPLLPPSGNVTFYDGAANLGAAPLVQRPNGPVLAILTVRGLSLGNHSFSMTYPGDTNWQTQSLGPDARTVAQASTSTALNSAVNPSALCQSASFTATVTAVSPGSGTPTGNVTFYNGATPLGTVNLSGGVATYSTSALTQGSYLISATYNGDTNFTTSTSSTLTQTVNAAVNWVLTSAPAAPDPAQGALVPFGPASLSPLTGAVMRAVPFDPNQHTVCDCGCGCVDDDAQVGVALLALVYNSATVNVQPIILSTLATDFCASVPSQIQAQLTWNNTAQGWVTFGTTGHSAGDVYALPLQVGSAVTSSGIYPWSVEVKATVGTIVYDRTASGVLPVVVNSSSPFGAGWAVGGTQFLLIGSAGVAIVDNRTGGFRYFTGTGPSYTSPANDQGTLAKNVDGTYTYTSKEQIKTNFDSAGRMTSQVDPHNLSQALAYTSGRLSTITQPDGGVATFSYNSSNLLTSVQEPGSRYLTLSYDTNNNLTSGLDAAGSAYTFTYDSSNRLRNEKLAPLNVTYTYSSSNGTLTQIDRGLGTTLAVTAAAVQGLGAATAINSSAALGVLTDALSHTTSYTLDALGRRTKLQTADGAVQNWALDAAGNPTTSVDQLGRVTSYSYNASEDVTQVSFPDGTFTTYQYDSTFHRVTQIQDARGNYTTFTYDGTTGDMLTKKDALGNVTTYTWSSGLKQTEKDALGRVTTHQWDTAKRRQTALIDALGKTTSYTFDSAGNRTAVQDALGHYTTLSYDGNRRLLTRKNALGAVATYAYDAAGDQTSAVDQLGRTTSTVYDQRGLPVSVTEAVGTAQQRTTTTNYDAASNVLYVTHPLGDITSFAYDTAKRPTARIEAYGSGVQRTTTTNYDAAGNVLSTIDGRGITTSFGYDARNRVTLQVDAYGTALARTTTTTYDAVGNVSNVTNPLGTVTSFGYDADNRPTQQIDAYGLTGLQRTTTTAYDAVGNVTAVTNPVAAVTSYGYDALNRPTQQIDAYGSSVQRTTTRAYDAVSNVTAVTNPRGNTSSYACDAINRLTQQVDAYGTGLARTLTTAYDAVGNVTALTDALGAVTSFSYDALNRRVTELDAYGTSLQRTLTTAYDADDNVTTRIDALGYKTTYNYDALNRRTSVQDAGGGTTTTAYDADDNVKTQTDPLGHTTTFAYDVLNRRTKTTLARGGIVTLAYDANNNLLSLVDPVNNVTQWFYDELSRKIEELDPLSNVAAYAYDAADRVTSVTDFIGQKVTYGYDLLNRETGESWFNAAGTATDTLTFTYDPNDNTLTASNNATTNTMAYDALDRITAVQAPFGARLTYSYDAADNRTQVQDNFGGTTTRVYDVLNRTATMTFGGSGQTPLREDFTYTARDQTATQTRYSNLAGTTTVGYSTFTYDSVMRLTHLQHQNGTGGNLANYTNMYDLASRITSETLNGGAATTYTYDAEDELTNDGAVTYTYDLNGNRTMTGYATGPANEITGDPNWSYFHDGNGNLIAKTNTSGEVWAFGYDNRNRLVTAADSTGAGLQTAATYIYDALGQCVQKAVWTQSGGSTVTTRFAYDKRRIWADLDGSSALVTRYLRGSRVLELLARVAGAGTAAWLLADRLGTIRNVSDNTGVVTGTLVYDGFGNVTSESSPTNSGAYTFVGYRWDRETGLYRPDPTVGRLYFPGAGRWNSRDLWGFDSGDENLYRYVRNNSVNMTDALGLQKEGGLELLIPEERAAEILLASWNDAAAVRWWLKAFAVLLAGTHIYIVAENRLAVLEGRTPYRPGSILGDIYPYSPEIAATAACTIVVIEASACSLGVCQVWKDRGMARCKSVSCGGPICRCILHGFAPNNAYCACEYRPPRPGRN